MFRFAFALSLGLAALGLTAFAADDKKEQTITGTVTCAKCDLKLEKKCATVVKDGDKVYYFDAASNKKNHGATCKEAKEGTVTGVVTKDGDKMVIAATKVEYKK